MIDNTNNNSTEKLMKNSDSENNEVKPVDNIKEKQKDILTLIETRIFEGHYKININFNYRKRMLKYFERLFNIIKDNYEISVKHKMAEGIHEMRVGIKRLRAYYNLIESISSNFSAKHHYSDIKKLFKTAGRLRDLQVQLEFTRGAVEKLNVDIDNYYNYLFEQEKEAQKGFDDYASQYKIKTLSKKREVLNDVLKEVSLEDATSNAQERFHNLLNSIQKIDIKDEEGFKEEILHDVRIKLKEARYRMGILQSCFDNLNYDSELDDKLRGLHRLLGKWHDNLNSIAFIDMYLEQFDNIQNVAEFDKIKEYLNNDSDKLLSDFEKEWSNFVKEKQVVYILN